jgi:MFS family permease
MNQREAIATIVRMLGWSAVGGAVAVALGIIGGLILHVLTGWEAGVIIGAGVITLIVALLERQHFARVLSRSVSKAEKTVESSSRPH